MLSFFPRGVLDEILNLIESVSEEFPSYCGVVSAPFVLNLSISHARFIPVFFFFRFVLC